MALRKLITWHTHLKIAGVGLRALASTKHPILVHIIATRRCNLACAYCNEYDHSSPPVPTETMLERIAHLDRLGTSMVSFSGGEPLLHPDLDVLIADVKRRGMFAELLTNGFLLNKSRIDRLNGTGLDRLQISIDNVDPDEASKKSLKVLDRKLEMLSRHARFDVNVNSVFGGGTVAPRDVLRIVRRARALGLSGTLGIIHDDSGQLLPLGPEELDIYNEFTQHSSLALRIFTRFKDKLVLGATNDWRCRAGARYLYVCEDGLVHFCSQQRGHPAIPLADYGRSHIEHAFHLEKPCAPYCTIGCAHAVAPVDYWRGPQTGVVRLPAQQEQLVTLRTKAQVA